MELHEQLEAVVDEHSFLAFVRSLMLDREVKAGKSTDAFGRGENGWENYTIEAFLEGAMSWAEDSNFGASQGLADASPWKRFATFLYCGKIYE
ncbi:MAG TPA: hypothetical protein VNW52_02790 [Burkholderiaceae bacterium]|jgi:hypothetical protein|nr:hypothetical protein [Burkholderiaceae bacterium]